jgi:hypothetical protein
MGTTEEVAVLREETSRTLDFPFGKLFSAKRTAKE